MNSMFKRALVGGLLTAALLVSSAPVLHATHVQAAKPWKIIFVAGIASDAFYITMNHGIQAEAKAEGLPAPQFTGSTAGWGPSLQIPFLNAAIAKKPDLILIAPTNVVSMRAPILAATKAGIKVIFVDTTLNDPSMALTTISTDNIAGGMAAADALAKAIGPKGGPVAGINTVAGTSTTDQRVAGFNSQLKKYPQLKNIGTTYATDNATRAASILKGLMAAHKDLAGVFAMNVVTGDGATAAAKEAGNTTLKLVEFDAGPAQVAALKAGTISALIAQYPYGIGQMGVKLGIQWLNGKHTLQKHYGTPTGIITPANVGDPKMANFLYTQ
jgi:ribose transport system substrate-binding protein